MKNVKNVVKSESWFRISNQVDYQVQDMIRYHIRGQIWNPVGYYVLNQVRNPYRLEML